MMLPTTVVAYYIIHIIMYGTISEKLDDIVLTLNSCRQYAEDLERVEGAARRSSDEETHS